MSKFTRYTKKKQRKQPKKNRRRKEAGKTRKEERISYPPVSGGTGYSVFFVSDYRRWSSPDAAALAGGPLWGLPRCAVGGS